MGKYTNISGYRFVEIDNIPLLRESLKDTCTDLNIKGTILLSPEGINVALSGAEENIDNFISRALNADKRFEGMMFKKSFSDHQPFNRMLVRPKKEIIAFGMEGSDPNKTNGPRLAPKELKEWLDHKEDVILIDTRNDYEVRVGTFKNSVNPGIKSFKKFPDFLDKNPHLKEKKIVTFCTGGVRCEKAVPYMINKGFKEVYQLDGGILQYFEDCGGEHWEGDCFVFDHRVALSPELEETDTSMCFRCRQPLTPEEQKKPEYVLNVSCPYCIDRKNG